MGVNRVNSEAGMIPEDWAVSTLGEAFNKIEAGVSVNSDERLASEYFVLKTSAVHDGIVDARESKPVVVTDYSRLKCPLQKGSIVISRMNTPELVGAVGYSSEEHENVFLPDRLWQISENKDTKFDFRWLSYLLNLPRFRDAVRSTSTGTSNSMKNISKDRLKEVSIPVPQIEEQKAIATVLSDIDELIFQSKQLVQKYQSMKQGCLQGMFPKVGQTVPKIRLPGFVSPWERRRFVDFTYPAGKRNKDNLNLEPFAITNEHGFIRQSEAHDEFGYMKDTDRTAYKIVEPHSFGYNPARINVGSIGYYEGDKDVIISSLYEVFQTCNCVDDRFLWHWFKSSEFPKWIEKLQEGSVRLYFYYDKLCECEMMMPSIDEQREIASYLDDLDSLILFNDRKQEKYKMIKLRVMEELLTGKIRLV